MKKETILQAFDGQLKVVKEELSDGSFVFNVWVGAWEIPAVDEKSATDAYCKMLEADKIARQDF